MKLIKPKPRTYSEIVQQIDIKFAFCTKKDNVITQLFDWVKCRDFLGDCLHSRDHKKRFNIYRFEFNYTKTPLDEDATKLLVKIPDGYIENVWDNQTYLDDLCTNAGLQVSTIQHIEDDIYYIEGDQFWQKTTQLISFYTLAIKCLAVEHKDSLWDNLPTGSNEAKYIKQISDELPKFLSCFKEVFSKEGNSSGYKGEESGHQHNHSGIATFLNKDYDNYQWKLANAYYKEYLAWQK